MIPVIAGLLLLIHTGAAWASPPLSPDQQHRVDAGEVVVLDTLPQGASESAQGGTAVAFVCAPPAAVWSILVNWPNHHTVYPRVTRAEVVRTDGTRVRVRYTVAIGPFSLDLYMDKQPDPASHRVTWRLAEDRPSRFFAENSGYWQVDPAGAGSLVTYSVGTRTSLPAFLTRGAQRDSLVTAVENVRRQAREGREGPAARSSCVAASRARSPFA